MGAFFLDANLSFDYGDMSERFEFWKVEVGPAFYFTYADFFISLVFICDVDFFRF